jgi:predicted cupin superfamily sugar epimerase
MALHPRAEALIRDLRLEPHVEGGFYREVFRSPARVIRDGDAASRSALTTIYFLLPAGEASRWHCVRSDEVWHFYEGEGLDLLVSPPDNAELHQLTLGRALDGDGPVHTVPAGWWQAARPVGAYALVGCTVGPGFEFSDFTFLRDDSEAVARLKAKDARALELL